MSVFAKNTSLAVGLFALIVFFSSITAYAAESGGVGAKPANPREENPRTQSIFVHEIKPGDSIEDAVLVTNSSGDNKNILVYPTDAQISSGGAFACEQKADSLDNEGSWIKLQKNEVSLDSNQSETIKFTISVPKDASPGEHNACIAIQAVEPPQKSSVSGVSLSFRSAIRVAITVPGEFKKGLSFESLSIKTKGNLLLINEKLRNSGNVSLDTNLQTKLKSLIGMTVNSTGGEFPILAGQTSEFNFELKKPFLGGFYLLNSSASYSDDPSTSLGESGNSTKTISSSKLVFVMPNTVMLVIYFVVAVLAILAIRKYIYKRKFDKEIKDKIINHTVKKNDTITSVSTQYQADWKITAKLNNLKPPYNLKGGDIIKVVPGEAYQPEKVTHEKTKKPKTKKNTPKISSAKPKAKSYTQKKSTKKAKSNKKVANKNKE